MLTTSDAYKQAIEAPLRRVKARVHLDLVGNFVDKGAAAAASSEQNAVAMGAGQVINTYMAARRKWAAVGFFYPDGAFHPIPAAGGEETGWWGNQRGDAAGALPAAETVTVTFPARKVKTFWWYGDAIRAWHPVDFKVEYYDSQAAAWVLVADVAGWAETYWEANLPAITAQVVTQSRLTVTRVVPALSCPVILEFDATVTETYEGDDLVEVGLLEELEADSGTLPIGNVSANEVDLKLNNIDGRFFPGNSASPYYGLLEPNRRIRPFSGIVLPDGTVEWLPLGVFWSGDWTAPSDAIEATTSGQDLLKFLADSSFSTSQVYQNKTLYDLAVIVLQDYGLRDTDYDIDADLVNYTIPYAWFDKMSHREALRLIAEAGLAVVFMGRDGRLRIKSYRTLGVGTAAGQVTDQLHIFSSDNPQQNSQAVNTVEVEARPLKPAVAQVLYEALETVTVPAGGTARVTVFFTEKPAINVQAPVLTGAVSTFVQSWTAYAWGGDLVLSNPGGADEAVTFTVSGQPLVEAGGILATAQDASRVAREGVIKPRAIRNDLIQTKALAQSIADAVLAVWSNAAKDVVSRVRGDLAVELGDRLTWSDSIAKVTGDKVVIRQRLVWEGGLAGEITGRAV